MSQHPELDDASRDHSQRTATHLRRRIEKAGGWIPFEEFMAQALYAPGLGYYTAGSRKLAGAGDAPHDSDFITAPELTPLFAQTLARPVAAILRASDSTTVLEFGAGTGALAADLLNALDALELSAQYRIIEVSADLRERQQHRLRAYGDRVQWLDTLPTAFAGCVLANEVLDAMPVRLFRWDETGDVLERGVTANAEGFAWEDRPAPEMLAAAVAARMPALPGYVSEINFQAEAFMRQMADWLAAGAALILDYGFPRQEYYHPQRAEGTLMCHLRHTAHADPLVYPGVQDITAHVDFTAMADAAHEAGLEIYGYLSQARFLMNAGLPEMLQTMSSADTVRYTQARNAVQKLISEAEMGELFKVLAVGRGITAPMAGFEHGDRLHML